MPKTITDGGFPSSGRTLVGSEILTVEELHEYLKIPRPTIYTLAQQGRIPAAKVGKHWRFKKSSINQWLRDQQSARASTHPAPPTVGDPNGHQ